MFKDVKQIVDLKQLGRHFDKLGDLVDEMFDGIDGSTVFGGSPDQGGIKVTKSKVDEHQLVTVEVEVPGCAPESVNVVVTDGRLVIEWTPRMTGQKQSRTFSLSKSADIEAVAAKVKDGYLTVTIPMADVRPTVRKVSVD